MTEPGALDELRGMLRDQLASRLVPVGWTVLTPAGSAGREMLAFIRPLDDEFAATAEILSVATVRPPLMLHHVLVGVAYEPLRRLSPLLDRFEVSVFAEGVQYVEDDGSAREDDEEEDEEEEEDDSWALEIASTAELPAAVDELAALILARAIPFAEGHASVDTLLAEFDDDDPDDIHPTVPALLAAAGRFDEARAALDRCQTDRGFPEATRMATRYARQLGRWIDSRGDPALLPSEPPPWPDELSPAKSFSQIWRETRAMQDAVDAVKRAGDGKDREELRAMLERELDERGLTQSPLWFEQKLDQLTASSAEQIKLTAEGLKSLGNLGLSIVRAIRGREVPDLSRPAWIEPPVRAAYEIPRSSSDQWTAVQLNPDARDWLDQIRAAAPRLAAEPTGLEAWLDRQPDGRLTVHIGERCVGTVDDNATASFRPSLDAASARDELPFTTARLTPRPTVVGYLLELQLPSSATQP